MSHLKFFLYLFFLNSIFFVCIFYLSINFDQPFADLNAVDIARGIVIGIILLSYTLLIPDLQSKFPGIRGRIKVIFLIGSLIAVSLTMLFLISI